VKNRHHRQSLQDILDAIRYIEEFMADAGRTALAQDRKTLFAVAKALENIGEAVKQVPAAVRRKYPDVPWKDMAGMRDVPIHDYFGIDAEIVTKTVREDLPVLKRHVAEILAASE
jgi:uncharacterized protein with HEPN domain